MSDSTGHLWRILRDGSPLVVVYYPSRGERDDAVDEVRLLAPDAVTVTRENHIDAAFAHPDAIVLLVVDDEEGAVRRLDLDRDRLLRRTAPAVLFLLSGGDAERSLMRHPSLASWLRGREYDPDRAEPDAS
jgi:hypothetical protein